MKKNHFLFALFIVLLVSCNKTKDSSNDNSAITEYNDNNSSTPVETYVFNNELVWSDEFAIVPATSINWRYCFWCPSIKRN